MAVHWLLLQFLVGALTFFPAPYSAQPTASAEQRQKRATPAVFGAELPSEEETLQEASLGFDADLGRHNKHHRGRPETALLGHRSSNTSDPLVRFLSDLSFRLPDSTTQSYGLSLDMTDLVCTGVEITVLDTVVRGSVQSGSVGLAARVRGVSGRCTGNFAATGFGQGNLTADIQGGASSSASLELSMPLASDGIPMRVEATACSASLDIEVALSGGYLTRLASWLAHEFSHFLERQVVKIACGKLGDFAAANLTQKLRQLNALMRPPVEGRAPRRSAEASPAQKPGQPNGIARPLVGGPRAEELVVDAAPAGPWPRASAAQSVDWTKQQALAWGNWFLGEVVGGPAGINKALRWALRNASAVTIPGPEEPLVKVIHQAGAGGLRMELEVGLKEVMLEGVESLSELEPFTAAAPDELRGKVGFGTEEQPAIGFRATALLSVKAVDPMGGGAMQVVQEEASVHLGLSKPHAAGRVQLRCDATKWGESRKVAQWYFGPVGCLKSLLMQAPVVKSLEVNFSGLAAPLTFTSQTQGVLEGDIAEALNNGIRLFNMVYERLLPGAIARFAGSPKCLSAINTVLGSSLTPGKCISAEAAELHTRKLPRYFSDWSGLLSGKLRDLVDNAVDGFLAQNNSRYLHGRTAIPPVDIGPVRQLRPKELAVLGTDRISKLRILEPEEGTRALSMRVDVACPTREGPYGPSLLVGGAAAVGPLALAGNATAKAPCGSLSASTEVVIDFWELMRMPLPPRMACTALQPFSELVVTRLAGTFGGGGGLSLQPDGGPARDPLAELCQMHPGACQLGEELGRYVLAPAHLTELLRELRDSVLASCEHEALASTTSARKTDVNGFQYADPAALGPWVIAGGVSVALGVVATTVVSSFAGSVMSNSMAAKCWRRWPVTGPLLSSVISLVLAACMVFRILASLSLPYASTTTEVVAPSSGAELLNTKLVVFTFRGVVKQFWIGGSPFCAVTWALTAPVASLLVLAGLAAIWLVPMGSARRAVPLRLALLLGRAPFSELETMGNTALALFQDVDMPLGLQTRLRLKAEAGEQVSLATTTATVLVGLALLALTSLDDERVDGGAGQREPTKKRKVVSLSICGSVLIGVVVFGMADFVHFRTDGGAGAVLPPVSLAGRHLTMAGATLAPFLAVVCVLAPVLQIVGVAFSFFPYSRGRAWQKVLVEVGMAFNCLDLFMLGYTLTFLEAVSGFVQFTVHSTFKPMCELLQKAVSEDCMVLRASAVPLGLLGLTLAALGSLCLMGLHIKDSLGKSHGAGTAETFLERREGSVGAGGRPSAGRSVRIAEHIDSH